MMISTSANEPSVYTSEFFIDRNATTRHAAERILGLVMQIVPPIKSAADVGCGVGTWLSVLHERDVQNICGFDGPWVNQSLLEIPKERFITCDLKQPISVDARYDLAISLEVAEHLPASSADSLIDSLTKLSDFVLFSAAIPNQGGVNHVNEQWQSYWAEKFSKHNYVSTDPIRSRIWSDQKISIPYRQNTILYVAQNRIDDVNAKPVGIESLSIAHPELYMIRNSKSVKQSIRDLRMTTSRKLSKIFGRNQ